MSEDLKTVVDETGRKLGVAEMDPADQLDLFEACGKMSTNPSWVGMALMICCVREIDGVPVSMPANPAQVKALGRKLGHKGLAAVRKAIDGEDDKSAGPAAATRTAPLDVELAKN